MSFKVGDRVLITGPRYSRYHGHIAEVQPHPNHFRAQSVALTVDGSNFWQHETYLSPIVPEAVGEPEDAELVSFVSASGVLFFHGPGGIYRIEDGVPIDVAETALQAAGKSK